MDDVSRALAQLRERFGELPVCLVGHSLGGRAALLSAGAPHVRGVVALAPFVYPQDGAVDARGCRILIVHGSADRVADPARAAAVARKLEATADVRFVTVRGAMHAMLRRHGQFSSRAASFAVEVIDSEPQHVTGVSFVEI